MNKITVCIPVRKKTLRETQRAIVRVTEHADVIEIWLDSLLGITRNKIKDLIKLAKKPVLVVCRGPVEGGSFKGSERERIDMLRSAVVAGAALIDVGVQTNSKFIRELKKACSSARTGKKNKSKLIVSWHDFGKMPNLNDLKYRVLKAKRLGADIVKIAVSVRVGVDNIELFELTKWARQRKIKIICIGMGDKGKISRIGCPLLGGYLTYVSLDEKSKTAKGQLTMRELIKYRILTR